MTVTDGLAGELHANIAIDEHIAPAMWSGRVGHLVLRTLAIRAGSKRQTEAKLQVDALDRPSRSPTVAIERQGSWSNDYNINGPTTGPCQILLRTGQWISGRSGNSTATEPSPRPMRTTIDVRATCSAMQSMRSWRSGVPDPQRRSIR